MDSQWTLSLLSLVSSPSLNQQTLYLAVTQASCFSSHTSWSSDDHWKFWLGLHPWALAPSEVIPRSLRASRSSTCWIHLQTWISLLPLCWIEQRATGSVDPWAWRPWISLYLSDFSATGGRMCCWGHSGWLSGGLNFNTSSSLGM